MRHVALLVTSAASIAVLAGCGGTGSSTSTQSAEEHFIKVANSLCTDDRSLSRAQDIKTVAAVRSLAEADRDLPRVARWISDLRARDRLLASLQANADGFGAHHQITALLGEAYRLDLKVYADGKALGLKCIRPPRRPIAG